MRTIALLSQKGGSGKTTFAVHLAVAATSAGYSSAIIDLDPQCSAANWGSTREAETPEVMSGHAARLEPMMKAASESGVGILFLDTPPAADAIAVKAAKAADLILIPCRAAVFDVRSVLETLGVMETLSTPRLVVLNAVPTTAKSGAAADAAAVIMARGRNELAPVSWSHRVAFSHGPIDGRTAQELEPNGKAAQEVKALWTWLCVTLGVPANPRVMITA